MKKRYIYWASSAVIISLVVWGLYEKSMIDDMKIKIENNYNRAFHELVDYVDDIDTLLEKSMLISSPSQMASISGELFRQTSAAKACLGQLPISEVQLENTEKFLSQVGDYTYMLSQNVINNQAIAENDYNNLSSLSDYASRLNEKLIAMQNDIYEGNISFGSVQKEAEKYFDNTAFAEGMLSNFEGVEKEFQEYPALIYDGPFSEHIERIAPVMTENEREITPEEALKVARSFLGDKGAKLQFNGASENNLLPSYSFSSESDGREINIAITKNGGLPLYYIDTLSGGEESLDFSDAIERAREFLQERGYNSLTESYYEKQNGVATINFAYEQGNVICYPDLLKVKVDLSAGEIVGFEAHGYIMNHKYRTLPQINLTEEEARAKISPHLTITSSGLSLIPKEGQSEKLCYEFKGSHNDRNFIIYINAENGREEDILMLIESENGILTM